MSCSRDEAKAKAAAAYNAAADRYDEPALSFWARFGRRTVERLQLSPGASVLDVCSGSGASAIPAAEAVGPEGRVLAVDLADRLLNLARAKAARLGLGNIEFLPGDMEALGFPDGSFDAVVCVFGIFFATDMPRAVKELWRMVKPGGRLAITTWGPNVFEPANGLFWEAVKAERAELYKTFNPWDRICDPQALKAMLSEAGVETDDVMAESGRHPLTSPDDWWTIALGSGYRGTLEQLDAEARERVRRTNIESLREAQVGSITANVVYAVAKKS
jgi:ubiquinone/menaquinone biosynthesis C-methylase UbiE